MVENPNQRHSQNGWQINYKQLKIIEVNQDNQPP